MIWNCGSFYEPHDDIPLRKIDHVRFFVGNARQIGVLLPQRLRVRRGRLRRAGDEGEARGRLRPAAGRDHVRAGLAAVARAPGEPAARARTATACRTSPWRWTTCGQRTTTAVARGAVGVIGPPKPRGRTRRLRVRHHPGLRRHHAHASSTATAIAASSRPATSRSTRTATAPAPATRSASPPSTTSSATSKKAR